ncbi:LOW QUALITY PROTEIN: hypothetical protein HZS_1973 [Henneguya salminicola]|nr:LOW QUALITY PROTEIN: hypothetical protein HZS_1973 [Henneguya salminicola]
MKLIGKKFASETYDVFYQSSIDIIQALLSSSYPFSHYYISGFIGSGIYIFSKYPLTDAFYTIYRTQGTPLDRTGDYYSNKGIAYCKLLLPDTEVKLIASHIHGRYSFDDFYILRQLQLYELTCFLRMITCDFIHQEKSNHMFTYVGYGQDHTGKTEKCRIDYIMSNQLLQAVDSKICFDELSEEGMNYSDHNGVEATFEFKTDDTDVCVKKDVLKELYKILTSSKFEQKVPFALNAMLTIMLIITGLPCFSVIYSSKIRSLICYMSISFCLSLAFALTFTTVICYIKQSNNYQSILKEMEQEQAISEQIGN